MFDFNIDHAAFMETIESVWDTININGLVGLVVNGLFVLATLRIVATARNGKREV